MALPVITPRTGITKAYQNIEEALGVVEGDVTALDGRLTTAESDIDTAESDIVALDGRIDTLETVDSKSLGPAELWLNTPTAAFNYTIVGLLPQILSIKFPDAATSDVHGTIIFPDSWTSGTISFNIFWTVLVSATTNVRWQAIALELLPVGGNITGTYQFPVLNEQVPAQNIVKKTTIGSFTQSTGKVYSFILRRVGAAGGDTFTNDAHLLGIEITRT